VLSPQTQYLMMKNSQETSTKHRVTQKRTNAETELPPITRFLAGLLSDANISEQNYGQHLQDKHLGDIQRDSSPV